MSLVVAIPGGKARCCMVSSQDFDFTLNCEKYTYPNQKSIEHYHRFQENIALFAETGFKC